MRRRRKNTGFYHYLEEHQLLGLPSDALDEHRKIYHAIYKRQYRREHKQKNLAVYKPEFTQVERATLNRLAKGYGMSITGYIRQCAIHCAENAPLLPQLPVMQKVIQMLELVYQRLFEIDVLSIEECRELKAQIRAAERQFVELYHSPPHRQ